MVLNPKSYMQVPYFEDKDYGLIYIARPPASVSLETVLSHVVSQQLRSPVPLPLDAVFKWDARSLDSWEQTFFLKADLSGALSSNSRTPGLTHCTGLQPFQLCQIPAMQHKESL